MRNTVLSTLVVIGILGSAQSAFAVPTFVGVFGDDPSAVLVGVTTVNGRTGTYFVQRRFSDNACWFQYVSPASGLDQSWRIQLGSGGDTIWIVAPHESHTMCGRVVLPLNSYNGFFLDLFGGAGADRLIAWAPGNSAVYGEGGRDEIIGAAFSRAYMDGGSSGDTITGVPGITNDRLVGGSGNDFLCDDRAESIIGGDGTEDTRLQGTATFISGVEYVSTHCP